MGIRQRSEPLQPADLEYGISGRLMRIGHVYNRPEEGGMQVYIHRISSYQRREGHTVYHLLTDRQHADRIEETGIPVIATDGDRLFQRAAGLGLDMLHVHIPLPSPPPAGTPCIRTVHNHTPYCPSGSKYLGRPGIACDRAYSLLGCLRGHIADRCGSVRPKHIAARFQYTWQEMTVLPHVPIISISQFQKDQLIKSGYESEHIHVLHHPAPTPGSSSTPPRGGVPRFLYLGRISREKGLAWLLRALASVEDEVHLDVAGEGYQGAEMRSLTDALGLGDRVTFHGWVSQGELSRLMQGARAVIFPSVWHEPAGLVSVEAAAAGRALIASSVGGIPEYAVDGRNALLVPPNDVGALAGAIERLSRDWHLARRMGEEGPTIASTMFSLEGHMNALLRLYEHAAVGAYKQNR